MGMWQKYETIKVWTVPELHALLADGLEYYNGAYFHDARVRTLIDKGPKCASCKTVGNLYALQRGINDMVNRDYHINLWSRQGPHSFMLMTRDHIIPKARGGSDLLSNSQCMCAYCNFRKSDKMPV